jgi:hypothetical protein
MTWTAPGADRPPGLRAGGALAAAQTVLLPVQGIAVPATAKVAFTSEDRVHDVIRDFGAGGFSSGQCHGEEPGVVLVEVLSGRRARAGSG